MDDPYLLLASTPTRTPSVDAEPYDTASGVTVIGLRDLLERLRQHR